VSISTPAFIDPYTDDPGVANLASPEDTLTIPPPSLMKGNSF
jgi:hypothetical protein